MLLLSYTSNVVRNKISPWTRTRANNMLKTFEGNEWGCLGKNRYLWPYLRFSLADGPFVANHWFIIDRMSISNPVLYCCSRLNCSNRRKLCWQRLGIWWRKKLVHKQGDLFPGSGAYDRLQMALLAKVNRQLCAPDSCHRIELLEYGDSDPGRYLERKRILRRVLLSRGMALHCIKSLCACTSGSLTTARPILSRFKYLNHVEYFVLLAQPSQY
jgi:hypothetical protein